MNVSIAITNDNGVVVRKTDEEPGVYMGCDSPSFLVGNPNVYIGRTFTEAKKAALQYLGEMVAEFEDTIEVITDLRVRHVD